jgi:hypothetical protein
MGGLAEAVTVAVSGGGAATVAVRSLCTATPVRYLVGINACVIGLISFGTLTAGIVETSGGNYNNDGLGAAIFGLIFLFFVVIVCVEALAKAISPKPGLLVSRVWRWICGRGAAA